jgi:hypothetical protein
VDLRLVRGRNEAGAPVRHLDGEVLRAVMCRLLGEGDERAYLTHQLLIEGTDPAWLAAEYGTSVHALTEQLRAALQWIAATYEALAYGEPGAAPGLASSSSSAARPRARE